jgi:hypothetical protein
VRHTYVALNTVLVRYSGYAIGLWPKQAVAGLWLFAVAESRNFAGESNRQNRASTALSDDHIRLMGHGSIRLVLPSRIRTARPPAHD